MHHHIIAYLHTHHAYWYWALVWAICCFMMIDHVISDHPQFSIYRWIYICTMYLVHICIYPNTQCSIYMYTCIHMYICIYPNTKYPIPNTKKGHQKIPFLLTSRHNSDLQSIRSKHEGIMFGCDQCDYKGATKQHLKTHKESVHDGILFACDQCKHKGTTKSNLRIHKECVHDGFSFVKIYDCDQCNYH